MTEYYTWQSLQSFSTAVTATAVITEFLKGIALLGKIPKRILSFMVALLITELSFIFTSPFSISGVVLQIFNALLVSLSSNGTYDCLNKNKG